MDVHRLTEAGRKFLAPEKKYTQREVDDLLKATANTPPSREMQLEEEAQEVDKQARQDEVTVAELVRKSNRILVSISSHAFPVDFFPNTINVEESRITIIKRSLFASEVSSIDIKNISNVFINTAIFFSQLVIISKTFEENEIKIRNLRPREAVFVRRIIEGLRIFENSKIDTSNYSQAELVAKLQELSTTAIVM